VRANWLYRWYSQIWVNKVQNLTRFCDFLDRCEPISPISIGLKDDGDLNNALGGHCDERTSIGTETVEEIAEKCVRRDSRSTSIGLNWAV
jgi:hypothetical protein